MSFLQVATIAWFEADSICGSHSIAIPIVLVLPYLFRLFQCLRQYKDTKEKTSLLNGKFFCFFYVILGFIEVLLLSFKYDSYMLILSNCYFTESALSRVSACCCYCTPIIIILINSSQLENSKLYNLSTSSHKFVCPCFQP